MRELCLTLDNFWFPAHLLDLLHHSGMSKLNRLTFSLFRFRSDPYRYRTKLYVCVTIQRRKLYLSYVIISDPILQCCGYGMIYSGSGSSFEFSEFRIRIQAKVPEPDPT